MSNQKPSRIYSEAEAAAYLSDFSITLGTRMIAKKDLKLRRINHIPSDHTLTCALPSNAPENYRSQEYHREQIRRIYWQTQDLLYQYIHPNAYGAGEGRTNKEAILHIKEGIDNGYIVIFHGDFKEFYNRIDQKELRALLNDHLEDRPELVKLLIRLQQLGRFDYFHDEYHTSEQGIIQGLSPSTLLANYYMQDFDRFCESLTPYYARYIDDFALCFMDQESAEAGARRMRTFLREHYPTLILHPVKTKIVEAQNLEFLGYAIR